MEARGHGFKSKVIFLVWGWERWGVMLKTKRGTKLFLWLELMTHLWDTFIMEALIFSYFMDMNGFYGSIREDGETWVFSHRNRIPAYWLKFHDSCHVLIMVMTLMKWLIRAFLFFQSVWSFLHSGLYFIQYKCQASFLT